MKKYDFITKEFLIKEYVENNKPTQTIANDLNCSRQVIRNRLKRFDIKTRKFGEWVKDKHWNWSIKSRKKMSIICKERYKTNRNPFKGHKHTKETKKKMRKNHADISGKDHWGYIDGRSLKPNYCIDCLEKGIKTEIKWQAIRCFKCEMLRRVKEEIFKGRNNANYGKSMKPSFRKYKNIWMRSNWEVLYAKYLDKKGINWRYEPKVFDLGNMTYLPDFYLPEKKVYVEIKGWMSLEAYEKLKKFIKTFPDIKLQILMKEELKKLGVLK